MVRVDYHVHTWASYDSRTGTAEVLDRAQRAGLDVVCITDHDTIDGAVRLAAAAPRGLRIVIGCEFTCDDGSHVIGLGLREMIAERRVVPLLEALRDQGATIVLPHPFRRGSGIFRDELRRPAVFVERVLSLADAVESFNARDSFEQNARNLELAARRGLAAVAGSDAHRPQDIGSTWVEYDGAERLDPATPRRVYGPPKAPAREHPLKRRLMELYHANERRLPPALPSAYRALRRRLHRDDPKVAGPPRFQHALPVTETQASVAAGSDQANVRPDALCHPAGAALAAPPADGHRDPPRLPG